MYYKLGRVYLKIMSKAKKYSDFELADNCIDIDNFVGIIEDLIFEIERLEEEIEDIKQDREDNYKHLSNKELYDVSDKNFI